MNSGIQDATNLAWKLALVAQGRAGSELFDSYHDKRHRAAISPTTCASPKPPSGPAMKPHLAIPLKGSTSGRQYAGWEPHASAMQGLGNRVLPGQRVPILLFEVTWKVIWIRAPGDDWR